MTNRTLIAVAVTAAFTLAGCNGGATRSDDVAYDTPSADNSVEAPVAATPPAPEPRPQRIREVAPKTPVATFPSADGLTGIAACDNYLSRYQSCHHTLAVFDEPTLAQRFTQLRETLTSDAKDPGNRSMVETRCIALETQMQVELDGRECEFDPQSVPLASETSNSK